ncbi:DUF4178 domain-containing protein [Tritonibacter litoralis]|nr:DUF4178 domain-containing protein [Tritonibacter litoralis]
MVTCDSCGSSLFLSDQASRLAGEQGVMHDHPQLFGLGDHIRLGSDSYHIVGHARFSYGRGTWDEFCALDPDGQVAWISLDEGDVVLQQEIPPAKWPRFDGYLKLGQQIEFLSERFTVVELAGAECVALRGSFDEPLAVGQSYDYINLQGHMGSLLSAEIEGDQQDWYLGRWYDPFEVEVHR